MPLGVISLEVEEALLLLLRRGWRVRLYGDEYAEIEPGTPRESSDCTLDEEEVKALITLYNYGFIVVIEHPKDTRCYTIIHRDQGNQYLLTN